MSICAYKTIQYTTTIHIQVIEARPMLVYPMPRVVAYPSFASSTTDTAAHKDALPLPVSINEDQHVGVYARLLNMINNTSLGGILGGVAAACTIVGTVLIIHW
ncbi:hypothetical protein DL93DRAFT_2084879 [Clavulina sp. PMI_390]|nr:hypothetical protein DL93DRAFT_2084879 [Clavulina sp. PMI_390]